MSYKFEEDQCDGEESDYGFSEYDPPSKYIDRQYQEMRQIIIRLNRKIASLEKQLQAATLQSFRDSNVQANRTLMMALGKSLTDMTSEELKCCGYDPSEFPS